MSSGQCCCLPSSCPFKSDTSLMGSVSHITEQKICPGKKLRCHVTSHMEIPLKMLLNIVLSNFFNRTDEKSDYKNLNICILDCFCFKRAEKKQDILITHPRLMVKDSQQVHGVIQILLSQRASERKVVEKVRTLKAFVHHSVKSGGGGGGFYLSALMARMSVSLLYRSPTSLIIFLRAWSSRFRLDTFTCEHTIADHIQTVTS